MSKKDDVLNAAENLFYKEGFHRTGIAKVAEYAQTTQRTLYKHFASKEDLILAIMERRELRYWQIVKQMDEVSGEVESSQVLNSLQPLYALKPLFTLKPFLALKQWLDQQNHYGCFYLHALAEYQGKSEAITDYVRAYKQRQENDFAARLKQDHAFQPHLPALLMLIYEGITARATIGSTSLTWEHIMEHVASLVRDSRVLKKDDE